MMAPESSSCHADFLQPEALRIGHATGGTEHDIGLQLCAAFQHHIEPIIAATDRADLRVEANVDTGLLHLGREKLPRVFVETR